MSRSLGMRRAQPRLSPGLGRGRTGLRAQDQAHIEEGLGAGDRGPLLGQVPKTPEGKQVDPGRGPGSPLNKRTRGHPTDRARLGYTPRASPAGKGDRQYGLPGGAAARRSVDHARGSCGKQRATHPTPRDRARHGEPTKL